MNLLTDNVFRVEKGGNTAVLSLPALLAALGESRIDALPGLQRHQEDAFHIFLCYLAGAVLIREGCKDACQDEAFWRNGIRRLTGGDNDNGWTLVVDDPLEPAFLQPPVTIRSDFGTFKPKATSPDELDVLQTAKNHDVKSARAYRASVEDWCYALLSLQTTVGFLGRDNYGIARMNGGFGSRPCVALVYERSPSARFQQDIPRLLAARPGLLNGAWGYRADGWVLTWLVPWDRNSRFSLDQLDPFFLEISRAVRLIKTTSGLSALAAPSKNARIEAAQTKGLMGDPWTPVNRQKASSLTVSATGFSPALLRALIFADGFDPQAMQRPMAEQASQPALFQASVLVRGQGTTDGFHEASVRIPGKAVGILSRGGPRRDQLAGLSKTGLNDAGVMQSKVLRPALYKLLQAGSDSIDFGKREQTDWINTAVKGFSAAWAADFFPWLWRSIESPDVDSARLEWLRVLRRKAERTFRDAAGRLPQRSGCKYRAWVRAEGQFHGSLFKNFNELKEVVDGHATRA